ncbi:DUF2332 domain-containing protein [Mycetocola sp. 2940]|uniref:DUF2332 domain-containing protein n=1 Tax=Mycetocola sp. 2940 TaxID=3156452 RepID=UPI0033924283
MEDETVATDLRSRYERFARIEADPRSPLYAEWARGVASDDEVVARIRTLPAVKQQANLVFASARYTGIPLAPWADVRDTFLESWDAIAACARKRSTQTNEARRLATLLPAFAGLPQPFALIEVGASAGLCLYPDRWRYDFGGGRTIGDADAPLLSTRANEATPIPDAVPDVAWRSGLDLEPLDVSNDDDMRWLETLIWPVGDGAADAERLDRLHAAADIARSDPPRLIRGDLLTETEQLIEEASRHAEHVIVFHSAVLAYLPTDARTEFAALMASAPATWIANEGLGIVAGTDRIPDAPAGAFALTVDGTAVALTDPHGSWLSWLNP